MSRLMHAFETSVLLAEKIASMCAPNPSLCEKRALADFATFGLFKQSALDPAAISALRRGLGWGVGFGLPALGFGHVLLRDAQRQGDTLIRDARNQALLTAAGIGGMQTLGGLLKGRSPSEPRLASAPLALSPEQKLAAAVLVDDVLEAATQQLTDPKEKHAALVHLARHRIEATALLRSLFA